MKVIVEIEIPIAKIYCVDNENEFEFTEFIANKLTRKWFGCGCFTCKIISKTKK